MTMSSLVRNLNNKLRTEETLNITTIKVTHTYFVGAKTQTGRKADTTASTCVKTKVILENDPTQCFNCLEK